MAGMSMLIRRFLFLAVLGLVVALAIGPAVLAQEDVPEAETTQTDGGVVAEVPEPAVEITPGAPDEEEAPWTFRYLVPTSMVLALLVVVGSIVAYFLRVVRTRYRIVQ